MIDALPLLLSDEGYQISRSVRLRSSASAYFSRTPASAGNRQVWTWSGWVKRGAIGAAQWLFTADNGSTDTTEFNFVISSSNTLLVEGSLTSWRNTTAVFRDPSAWYHIVIAIDTTQATANNRIRLYVNGSEITAFSTLNNPTQNSDLAVNQAITHYVGIRTGLTSPFDGYLTEINFIDGQALTPSSFGETNVTTGVWQPKKYAGTYGTNGFYLNFSDPSAAENRLIYSELVGSTGWSPGSVTVTANSIVAPNGSTTASLITANNADANVNQTVAGVTNGVTYTFSVWLKSTSNTPIRLYADTSGSGTYVFMDVNVTTTWARYSLSFTATGTTVQVVIGAGSSFSSPEILHAWGAQLNSGAGAGAYIRTVASPATGVVALGQDFSLGDQSFNTWTANNISVTAGATYDSMLDVPTPWADGGNGRGNYCVFNPLDSSVGSFTTQMVDGNLKVTTNATNSTTALATMAVSTGKWYWEMRPTTVVSATQIGIFNANASVSTSTYLGQDANGWAYSSNGVKINNASSVAYGATFTSNDVIGVALDLDSGTIEFYKNGTSQGVAYTGLSGTFKPAIGEGATTSAVVEANFGQRPFAYTPPSGFRALNTQNLPEPLIRRGDSQFNASLWTGNGTSQTITNGSFQPDLVWVKRRSAVGSNYVSDSVRGASVMLSPNQTIAEFTNAQTVSGFTSTGFSVGNDSEFNASGSTYVGWQWKEGATQGFDIVTWAGNSTSGRTVAHSLGVAPNLIITKSRTNASSWVVGIGNIAGFGVNDYLTLNTTSAVATSSTFYQAYGSSTFTVGVSAADEMNKTGNNYVSYLFAEVAGFSRFGRYTGNGSADGPFIFTGFRPAFVMIKATSAAGYNWTIEDSARSTFNASDKLLYPNLSNAEQSGTARNDFLSNGFKARDSSNNNVSGVTYIYAAFAEVPFRNALAR